MAGEGWDSEIQRVAAVRALRLLDTPREERFDRITRVAQRLMEVPIALVSLVDMDRQWFKSCIGLDASETRRSVSFCSHAIAAADHTLFEVPDATADPRFADNPQVTGEPHIRFYAGQPVAAPSGHLIGTLCVVDRNPRELTVAQRAQMRDLAAWVELECTVVQASQWERDTARTRRDFVSVVSHELRTPLTSIHGSLELVMSGRFGDLSPQLDRLVGIAAKNTDRLIRLAEDVLDLHLMQRGTMRLRVSDVSLPDVVEHAVQAVEQVSRTADVPVRAACGDVEKVRGDADRLVQVITNLLANAVKVSPVGAPVELDCSVVEDHVVISVRDHGPGVPAQRLEEIFEPFVQFDVPEQRSRGGAGLGLAITRGIVDAHGGTVSASPAPGGGSVFEVVLPLRGPEVDKPWW